MTAIPHNFHTIDEVINDNDLAVKFLEQQFDGLAQMLNMMTDTLDYVSGVIYETNTDDIAYLVARHTGDGLFVDCDVLDANMKLIENSRKPFPSETLKETVGMFID